MTADDFFEPAPRERCVPDRFAVGVRRTLKVDDGYLVAYSGPFDGEAFWEDDDGVERRFITRARLAGFAARAFGDDPRARDRPGAARPRRRHRARSQGPRRLRPALDRDLAARAFERHVRRWWTARHVRRALHRSRRRDRQSREPALFRARPREDRLALGGTERRHLRWRRLRRGSPRARGERGRTRSFPRGMVVRGDRDRAADGPGCPRGRPGGDEYPREGARYLLACASPHGTHDKARSPRSARSDLRRPRRQLRRLLRERDRHGCVPLRRAWREEPSAPRAEHARVARLRRRPEARAALRLPREGRVRSEPRPLLQPEQAARRPVRALDRRQDRLQGARLRVRRQRRGRYARRREGDPEVGRDRPRVRLGRRRASARAVGRHRALRSPREGPHQAAPRASREPARHVSRPRERADARALQEARRDLDRALADPRIDERALRRRARPHELLGILDARVLRPRPALRVGARRAGERVQGDGGSVSTRPGSRSSSTSSTTTPARAIKPARPCRCAGSTTRRITA